MRRGSFRHIIPDCRTAGSCGFLQLGLSSLWGDRSPSAFSSSDGAPSGAGAAASRRSFDCKRRGVRCRARRGVTGSPLGDDDGDARAAACLAAAAAERASREASDSTGTDSIGAAFAPATFGFRWRRVRVRRTARVSVRAASPSASPWSPSAAAGAAGGASRAAGEGAAAGTTAAAVATEAAAARRRIIALRQDWTSCAAATLHS